MYYRFFTMKMGNAPTYQLPIGPRLFNNRLKLVKHAWGQKVLAGRAHCAGADTPLEGKVRIIFYTL